MSFRRSALSLVLFATLAVAGVAVGCGGGSSSKTDDNGRAAGHWQIQGSTTFGFVPNVTYLDLAKDGSALLNTSDPVMGAVSCGRLIFAVLNDKILSIQFPGGGVNYFQYKRSGSTLTLTDAFGAQTTFKSVASIPAASTCTALPASSPLYFPATNSPTLGYGPHFAGEGSRFWYFRNTYDVGWYDLATGSTGGGFLYGQMPDAVQGATIWAENNDAIVRMDTAGTVVDTVTTSDPTIGIDLSINTATFDGTDLWLGGNTTNANRTNMWLKIDSGVEPDLLLSSGLLPSYPEGMAVRNGHLFVLSQSVGDTLIEIDPATGAPVQSYLMPPGPQYWQGLAIVNGTVYSLSADDYNHPVAYPLTGI